ncbi:SCP2 sterol-binding domain-containing protein [Aeromicrobium sp. PE09-221]|uniref:SCP2 sterol-binding domain-containing protein n=1 Tax=Aeromicrobium sp. PE09-221 TaxID=1898043 RepID=UPI0014820D53|nr:SCP2 sterol-binding domain-containing protein [Aeromicrobium sp. PE09-221]
MPERKFHPMSASEFLNKLPAAYDADAADGAEGTVQLNVSTPAYVVLTSDGLTVHDGTAADPDVTLIASDEDLISVLRGDLDGVEAFLAGKLQVEGDLQLAKDIPTFFNQDQLA